MGKRGVSRTERPASDEGRESREQELRASMGVRPMDDQPWVRGSSLDAPPPRPGMGQKWVRVELNGTADQINLLSKVREGWMPRDPATVASDFPVPTLAHGRLGNVISVVGMVLMEMPLGRIAQRNAHYEAKKKLMTAAIEGDLNKASAERKVGSGFGEIQHEQVSMPVRERREPRVAEDQA